MVVDLVHRQMTVIAATATPAAQLRTRFLEETHEQSGNATRR
jgi:hypothetical protein